MQIWKGHTWQLQKKWESKMQIEKMQIANGGKIERANATWKGAHLTNEEYMEGTNASGKEATSYVKNIDRWNATREKGKCQMQHTWKQKISLDKVVKPAQKTKETLNLKREVRGEPVKPKKNAQCWGSRLPSGQVTSRKGRSPIRIGDLQTKLDTFWKKSKKTEAKTKTKNTNKKTKQNNKTTKKKKKQWALSRVIPWEMGPRFPEKQSLGLGLGGCANQPPTLSWKFLCPCKCWCRDRNPNRTETHSCTYCMWGKFKNLNAWKPGNRDCISCTPPKCESSGCPEACSAICVFELTAFYLWFIFALHCVFLHLHFLCIYETELFFFCTFFLQLFFVCFLRSIFFALHAAFFQGSKFLR